jgi:hypothetical protein
MPRVPEIRPEYVTLHSAETSPIQHTALSTSAGLQIEPTVGGAYAHAWEVLKTDYWRLLLVGFVAWLLGFVVSAFINGEGARGSLSWVYQYLIGTPIFYGSAYAWLRAVSGTRPTVSDLFVPFQRNWVACVLAQILLTIVVVIGFVLLVVPGIILAVRLSFVPFLIVDEGRGPVDALLESWNRTAGYGLTIFYTALLGIVIVLVGLVLLIVGSIAASMLVYLAFASFYAAITARKNTAVFA